MRYSYLGPMAHCFRARRNKAMETGDVTSVAYIYEFILWDIERHRSTDFDVEKVIQQLSGEYAFPGLADALVSLRGIRDRHPQRLP